ncbi:MAG: NAD(+)/NADH kinase [Actinomycetota bacterium]|nr:NAD(+)/NADH kinase [Actinomycetota bacterium]
MAVVVLVVNDGKPRAVELAHQAADWLSARDHEVRLSSEEAGTVGLAKYGQPPATMLDGADVAVSLGGDGTMLRAVCLVARAGVPVLGVNLGNLGYLTEVEPDRLTDALEAFLTGAYRVEERLMLSVTAELGPSALPTAPTGRHLALNEAVVEKSSPGQVVHVSVSFGGRRWTTYAADGLIVATPTGSTAYSFSAHGPILPPELRAILMTPVSAHMPFDRSLVLAATETIRIELIVDRTAELIVDGRELGQLNEGDAILCQAAPERARLITFGQRDFYGILKAKFGLSDR